MSTEIVRSVTSLVGNSLPDPVEANEMFGGIQAVWRFDNGYGASVISHRYSYGIELAVLKGDDITYDTPITDDIIGHIADAQELSDYLTRIMAL